MVATLRKLKCSVYLYRDFIYIYHTGWHVGWFFRWHDIWHPWSLTKTLDERIPHHLELTHLCHLTHSQEDDCYDYTFIRLAVHCLQCCGSARANLWTNTFLWKPSGSVKWPTQQLLRTFPLLLHKCVILVENPEEYSGKTFSFVSSTINQCLTWKMCIWLSYLLVCNRTCRVCVVAILIGGYGTELCFNAMMICFHFILGPFFMKVDRTLACCGDAVW